MRLGSSKNTLKHFIRWRAGTSEMSTMFCKRNTSNMRIFNWHWSWWGPLDTHVTSICLNDVEADLGHVTPPRKVGVMRWICSWISWELIRTGLVGASPQKVAVLEYQRGIGGWWSGTHSCQTSWKPQNPKAWKKEWSLTLFLGFGGFWDLLVRHFQAETGGPDSWQLVHQAARVGSEGSGQRKHWGLNKTWPKFGATQLIPGKIKMEVSGLILGNFL